MEIFLETSAILSWLFNEKESAGVMRAINRAKLIIVSKLAVIETKRALHRALSLSLIKEVEYLRLLALFEEALKTWRQLEIVEYIQHRASQAFPREPLRTLDALHLSSALFCLRVYPKIRLLSLDKRMLENADLLGLEVV